MFCYFILALLQAQNAGMVCFELIRTFGFVFDKGVNNTACDCYGTFLIISIAVDRYSDL